VQTEIIKHDGATFTVSTATVLIGMVRARLRRDGERAIEPNEDRRLLRILVYPDICAAVVSAEGLPYAWPPTFEQFLALPDSLDAALEDAIYRLNPHWLPGGAAGPDPKATAPASTPGSTSGRKRKTKTASSSRT